MQRSEQSQNMPKVYIMYVQTVQAGCLHWIRVLYLFDSITCLSRKVSLLTLSAPYAKNDPIYAWHFLEILEVVCAPRSIIHLIFSIANNLSLPLND
jgi:hypothetical protein